MLHSLLFLTALLAGVPEAPLFTQWPESLNMHSTWHWNRGTVQTVETRGGVSYCGAASSILSVKNGDIPALRGVPILSVARTDLPGIAQDVLVEGDRAYVVAGRAGLVVLDLTNPDTARLIGRLDLPGYAWSLSKDGNLVMVASGPDGLFAVDVSLPDQPRLISSVTPTETTNAVVLSQGYAYLAAAHQGLSILDAHDPTRLRTLAQLRLPGSAQAITIRDTFAWIACGDSGVQTVNIARPRQPLWIRRDAWPGALRITLAESLAAIPAGWNGVFLVNVKRPEEPYLYRWLAIAGAYAQDAAFAGNIMSVAAGPAGLLYYDVSNPYLPMLIDTLRQPGYTNSVVVQGNTAWTATSRGLYAVDLAPHPSPLTPRPQELGFCPLRPPPSAVALLPNAAVVAIGVAGIGFVTTTDPAHPVLVATLPIPGFVNTVAARDSWVAVGTADSGVQIVAAGNPQLPQRVASLVSLRHAVSLSIDGQLLAIVTNDSGSRKGFLSHGPGLNLQSSIFNLQSSILRCHSEPFAPCHSERSEESQFRLKGRLREEFPGVAQDRFCNLQSSIFNLQSSIWLCSIADPRNPALLARIFLPGRVRSVSLAGNLAATCGDLGLFLIDVRDPRAPFIIRQQALAAPGWKTVLADTLCYVAADWAGVVAFNIADPRHPWPVGYCAGPSVVRSLALLPQQPGTDLQSSIFNLQSSVIAGDVYSGLLMMQLVPPAPPPPLLTPRPSPIFNLQSSIFNLQSRSPLTVRVLASHSPGVLSLLDPTGRRLQRVPVNPSDGWQEFQFPTDPLGAGVYFVRFENSERAFTTRIQIVR